MYVGENEEALKLLATLKILSKDNITPFELSADIYRKKGQYEQASAEYDVFFRLNPSRKASDSEEIKMGLQEIKKPKFEQKAQENAINRIQESEPETIMQKRPPANLKTSPAIQRSNTPAATKPATNSKEKKIKGLFIVDPDSLSYF
jgi:tetratricopeptide (TPR) repeat protein